MRQQYLLLKGAERVAQLRRLTAALAALPEGSNFRVEVSEVGPKQSDAQRAYLWGVCYPAFFRQGGEQLAGWTDKELHEFLLGECFGWERVSALGRTKMRAVRRSSRLNKQEYSDYIDFVIRKAAEFGIEVPEPGADWYARESAA